MLRTALSALRRRPPDLGDLATLEELDSGAATDGLSPKAAAYLAAAPHELLWGVPSERLSVATLTLQLHVFRGQLHEIRGGTSRLIDGLAEGLDVRHRTPVHLVEPSDEGVTLILGGVAGRELV